MINRINLILKAKNITARQFAEEIGIQPSGMSHIMSGRNNPSLEFVNKVVRRYPEIDANWLLLGRGEMYMTGSAGLTPGPSPKEKTGLTPDPSPKDRGMDRVEPTLFSVPEATQGLEETGTVDRETQHAASLQEGEFVSEAGHGSSLQTGKGDLAAAESAGRRLVKILMFYDDHTFEEYYPRS